jgi:hypothetical protein
MLILMGYSDYDIKKGKLSYSKSFIKDLDKILDFFLLILYLNI